jgi:hypothetical protein
MRGATACGERARSKEFSPACGWLRAVRSALRGAATQQVPFCSHLAGSGALASLAGATASSLGRIPDRAACDVAYWQSGSDARKRARAVAARGPVRPGARASGQRSPSRGGIHSWAPTLTSVRPGSGGGRTTLECTRPGRECAVKAGLETALGTSLLGVDAFSLVLRSLPLSPGQAPRRCLYHRANQPANQKQHSRQTTARFPPNFPLRLASLPLPLQSSPSRAPRQAKPLLQTPADT